MDLYKFRSDEMSTVPAWVLANYNKTVNSGIEIPGLDAQMDVDPYDATGGWAYFDVGSTKTRIYKKYLTGTTAAAADVTSNILHGLTSTKIVAAKIILDGWCGCDGENILGLKYDAANMSAYYLSSYRSKTYTIEVDYTE